MKKKLYWKAFDSFEAMEAFGNELYASLTPGQRLERFFALLELRLALGALPKAIDAGSFILKRKPREVSPG